MLLSSIEVPIVRRECYHKVPKRCLWPEENLATSFHKGAYRQEIIPLQGSMEVPIAGRNLAISLLKGANSQEIILPQGAYHQERIPLQGSVKVLIARRDSRHLAS